jgi:WD40 repeat protein
VIPDGVVCVFLVQEILNQDLGDQRETSKRGIGMISKRYLYTASRDEGSRDADDYSQASISLTIDDGDCLSRILIQLQPVSATFPGKNGKIAFSRNVGATTRQIQYEIFTVNPDGSGLTQLTFTGPRVFNSEPRWSADGMKIVFVSNRVTAADADGNYEIWTMNADGSGQTQLTFTPTPVFIDGPAFSPDGSKIIFASNQPPSTRINIWVMNADGSNQKKLSTPTPPESDDYPAWSPDGTKIAFARAIYASIIVMNAADGSNPVDITESQPNSGTDVTPNWQPLFANPVGGVVTPVNKIEILTPYLPLAGLIAAVSAVVAVRKRRD